MRRAAFGYPPISLLLLDSRELRSQWNDPSFGITPDRVRASILRLMKSGDVLVYRASGDVRDELSSKEAADVLRSSSPDKLRGMMLGLTMPGSCRWEAVSGYNWEKYSVIEGDSEEDNAYSIRSVSWRTMLHAMRHLIPTYYMVSSLLPWQDEVITPWAPTYWESFLYGFRLQFAAIDNLGALDDVTLCELEEETYVRCEVLQQKYLSWESGAVEYAFRQNR